MSFAKFIFFVLLLKMIVSCSPSGDSKNSYLSSCSDNPLIIGDNDWIHFEETGDDNQNLNEMTVGLVTIPKLFAKCTGFMINEDTLMTNNHCIPDEQKAENVTVHFRIDSQKRLKYDCSEFIMTSFLLDFTLMRCAGKPGREVGWVGLSQERPLVNQSIYVVQENCDYIENPRCTIDKFVSFGKVLKSQTNRTYHNADTLGGSSGSPVFSVATQQVVAIHNSGSYGSGQEPDVNLGVPMFQIKSFIESMSNIDIYEDSPMILPITEDPVDETTTPCSD